MAQNLIAKHIIEAVVKPTLDKNERERLNSDLSRIFADASNIDFNTRETRESLNNLAKAFQTIFEKAGDKSIDFEKLIKMPAPDTFAKLGEVAAKQFWDAWNAVSKVQSPMDFSAELEKLKKQRDAIIKEQSRVNQNVKARSRMDRLESFNLDSAHLIKVDGDIGKEAQKIVDELYEAADKIDEAESKYGKSSSHYKNTVMDAQETYNTYLRMQKTLGQMMPSQLLAIPKDIRALYDKLGQERDRYEASGGMNIPFEEDFAAEVASQLNK